MRRATELPGEEDGQLDGILTSSGSADASADRDGRTTTDGTRVLDSARGTDALKGRPSTTQCELRSPRALPPDNGSSGATLPSQESSRPTAPG